MARYHGALFGLRLLLLLRAHPAHPALQAAALAHLAATTPTPHWAATAARLQEALARGTALSQALATEPALPRRLAPYVQLGERTNDLPAALAALLEAAAEDHRAALARFERGAVLLLYVLLGLGVGTLVLAVYLPIFMLGALV